LFYWVKFLVEAEVNQAKLKAEALRIETEAEIESRSKEYKAEIAHRKVDYSLIIT